ncbi:hypothetical protein [Bradyrhizobium sp. DASA03120]|uniref:hypothetical protein n=1 Tax=Bradyrhizobium sp. SMVTL-02 TaxID=3395917 RepID=UPI003F6FB07D
MDRTMLQEHLAMAERHVALGEKHLVKQEALIAELDRDGHDTLDALKLLATMRATQRLHLQHRDRLLSELGREPSATRQAKVIGSGGAATSPARAVKWTPIVGPRA